MKTQKRREKEKGVGLIWTYLVIAILGLSCAALYGMCLWQSKLTSIDIDREKAFYFAEAGVDQKLYELRTGNLSDIGMPPAQPVAIDNGTYSVDYDSATKTLISTGTSNGASRIITVTVKKMTPQGIHGAISGNGNMSTNGSIIIDGRDYNLIGSIAGNGTFGVSTSGTYSQGGSSQVGGNGAAPADPAPAGSFEQNRPDVMPSTPEEILGLPPGSLDEYKTTTIPTLPMHDQIIYVTGVDSWLAPDFGTASDPSSGILILHNSAGNAELKNLHGYFNGIIITDTLVHINGDAVINGAVAIIQANSNIGNGNAHVNYSLEAINNALNAGYYSITSWKDSLNQ